MRVLLSTYGSRGDVEPMLGLVGQLRWRARAGVRVIPAAAGVRSATEKLGPWRPFPPEMADAKSVNALLCEVLNTHRASIGLAPVNDVRDYVRDDVIGTPDVDVVSAAVDAIQASGRRTVVARGWADLTLTDDGGDCIGAGGINQAADQHGAIRRDAGEDRRETCT